MRKQVLNALLYGALVVSSGTTVISCSDTDTTDLENRVAVLEGLIDGIKDQLSHAISVGNTVTNYDAANRKITLNDGTVIDLGAASQGGGEASNITVGDGVIIVSIGGEEYALALAVSVNSLVFCPSSTNPVISIDNATNKDGVTVKFLATPGVPESALANAKISIADARDITTRANSDYFSLSNLHAEDELIVATLKVWGAEAGKTYTVAVRLELPGTVISSNYFYIDVADDVVVTTADLSVAPTLTGFTDVVTNEDASVTVTLPDGDGDVPAFLSTVKFQDMIKVEGESTLYYSLAPAAQQNEAVRNNYANLSANLAADGTWTCNKRPGTNGGEEGMLVLVKNGDGVTRAMVHIKVVDPFENIDFQNNGITGIYEAELYGRENFVDKGHQELSLPELFTNWQESFPICHQGGGDDGFFAQYQKFNVKSDELGSLIYNDGSGNLALGDNAKKYLGNGQGVFWYYRGVMIVVPESLANAGENGKYVDETGEYAGAEGYGYDTWGSGNAWDFVNNPNAYNFRPSDAHVFAGDFGWKIDSKGTLTTPDNYTGYGIRLAIAAGFEYAYGVKRLCGGSNDQLGMIFINRRLCPEGTTMPKVKL